MSDYIPLSEREKPEAERADPSEGVPLWLRPSIADWVEDQMKSDSGWDYAAVRKAERSVQIVPPLVKKPTRVWFVNSHEGDDLLERIRGQGNDKMILNLIDYLLRESSEEHRNEMDEILKDGKSAWGIGPINGMVGLVRRMEPSFRTTANQAMAGDAQHHRYLQKAWGAAYGRNPQPDTAYSDAVRAVEAAAIPVVRPSRSPPTLGLVIAEIRDHPKQFATRLNPSPPLEPIEAVRQMLSLLWKSQWDRHGVDDDVPLTVSQQEAEDALALAVTLVRWFDTGAVSRRD